MQLVVKETLKPWGGNEPRPKMIDTATVTYEDGRKETIKVEPYEIMVKLPPNVGVMWTKEELAEVGLVRVVPATLPDGKQFVDLPTYVIDGDVAREIRATVDLPPPPDTVTIAVEEHDALVEDAEKWRLRNVEPGAMRNVPTAEAKEQ